MSNEEKVSILLVDDTPANLMAWEAVLTELNQKLVKANSGRAALKHLLRQDFAVILLDVNMPGMDGYETAALIRQRARSEHTPIIFITAHDATESGRARGYDLGAVDYIYAPVVSEILKAKVASFVQLSKIQLLHQRAEARARSEAIRAKALVHIATRLNARLDLETVLKTVCEASAQTVDVPIALVALYDKSNQLFSLAGDYGLPAEYRRQIQFDFICTRDKGQTHQTKIVVDVQALPNNSNTAFYQKLNIRTSLSVMMQHDGRPIGCLILFTRHNSRHFTDDELEFLRGLVDQAALAIANTHLLNEVRNGRERLRQLAQKLVLVQEEERRYLSRELHDQVGQVMFALHMHLESILQELPAGLEISRERLADAVNLSEAAMADVRTIAHSIRSPAADDTDLNTTLRNLCRDFAHYTHLPILYDGVEVPQLSEAARISFYRFLQESLTNAAKHAQAEQVFVTLACSDSTVHLSVEDDGIGFNAQNKKRLNGVGLLGMQERFEMLGGRLDIQSQPGQGTRLIAHVFLQEAN